MVKYPLFERFYTSNFQSETVLAEAIITSAEREGMYQS